MKGMLSVPTIDDTNKGSCYAATMIRDLEEQLLRVDDQSTREFMTEAVRCYHAGAYRAAVVQAIGAATFDLKNKISTLASSGGAPANLVDKNKAIETKFEKQEPIEQDVIAAAEEKEAGLLAPADAKLLRSLVSIRHLCAHPSGHQGSAEEARHAITSVIDLVLSQLGFMGMIGINEIEARINSGVFFPNHSPEDMLKTVKAELDLINPRLFKALVARLADVLVKETGAGRSSSSSVRVFNAKQLLRGMVLVDGETKKAVWSSKKFLELVCKDEVTQQVLAVLDADTSALSEVDILIRGRLLALLRNNIQLSETRTIVRSLVAEKVLSEDEKNDLFIAFKDKIIQNWRKETAEWISDLAWPELTSAFFDRLIERCGDFDFYIANAAIKYVQEMSAEDEALMGDDRLAIYVLRVARPRGGNAWADEAIPIRNKGLGTRTAAIDALVRVAGSNPAALVEQNTDWMRVAEILKASGRVDAVTKILPILRGKTDRIPFNVRDLSDWGDPNVTSLANELAKEWDDFFQLLERQGAPAL